MKTTQEQQAAILDGVQKVLDAMNDGHSTFRRRYGHGSVEVQETASENTVFIIVRLGEDQKQ